MISGTRVNWNAPMCPCVEILSIPTTVYTEIVVGIPYPFRNGEYNGVTKRIYVPDDGLEFVAMFE